MSRIADDVLYHFVGFGTPHDDEANFETLCAVLTSEQIGKPGMPNKQITIDPTRPITKGELIQQSITCYCDISFDDLGLHMSKYGRFGVGVNRQMLCRFGARAVHYIPVPSSEPFSAGLTALQDAKALLIGAQGHLYGRANPFLGERKVGYALESVDQVVDRLRDTFYKDFLAFVKFYDSDLPVDHPEHYYAEREWRKFGPFNLRMGLEEIVVPSSYVERLIERFPQHRGRVRPSP